MTASRFFDTAIGLLRQIRTTRPHSEVVKPRHSSGLHLYEAADVVIDTGAPLGDAAVQVDGLDDPVEG